MSNNSDLLPSLRKMREFNFEELARPRANGDTRGRVSLLKTLVYFTWKGVKLIAPKPYYTAFRLRLTLL